MTLGEGAPLDERFELVLPVRLRACTAADLPALECGGAFTHHRALIAAAFRRQQAGAVVMIVAEAGRALAGQLWVDLERRRAAGAGFLWALRVAPWIEGRGLGTRLLAAGERVVRARRGWAPRRSASRSRAPGRSASTSGWATRGWSGSPSGTATRRRGRRRRR